MGPFFPDSVPQAGFERVGAVGHISPFPPLRYFAIFLWILNNIPTGDFLSLWFSLTKSWIDLGISLSFGASSN